MASTIGVGPSCSAESGPKVGWDRRSRTTPGVGVQALVALVDGAVGGAVGQRARRERVPDPLEGLRNSAGRVTALTRLLERGLLRRDLGADVAQHLLREAQRSSFGTGAAHVRWASAWLATVGGGQPATSICLLCQHPWRRILSGARLWPHTYPWTAVQAASSQMTADRSHASPRDTTSHVLRGLGSQADRHSVPTRQPLGLGRAPRAAVVGHRPLWRREVCMAWSGQARGLRSAASVSW
jgi:hypothetical protein